MIRKPCELDTDFQRSMAFHRDVEVWVDGQLDTIGKIKSFTDFSVMIDENHFIRENCKFMMV
ncbi:hypothetical protein [Paenibacillus sp. FSL F4-0243]|uniref:hypothetical protein n=1 Tax=Paenibacillus sp. FSL F4-0243 TaxID=2954732 RepID=UPI0030D94E36